MEKNVKSAMKILVENDLACRDSKCICAGRYPDCPVTLSNPNIRQKTIGTMAGY